MGRNSLSQALILLSGFLLYSQIME